MKMIPLHAYDLSRKPDDFATAIIRIEGYHSKDFSKHFVALFSGYGADIISKEFLLWLADKRRNDYSGCLPDGRGWSLGEVDGTPGVYEEVIHEAL